MIAEVLRHIVQSAAEVEMRSVAALSTTAHIFHDAAQDALWERVTDLSHLFRCFPGDVWSRRPWEEVRNALAKSYQE